MKSATGFPVRRRLSLHHIIRGRRIKALAGAALLALCLAAPALAAVETNPESLDRHPEQSRVLVTGDADEAPALPARPAQFPEPPRPSLPPPGSVVEAVSVLRMSCPEWQIGSTPGYETEAHVYRLLAGNDTAYADGAVAGSWMTAAFLGGLWLHLGRLGGEARTLGCAIELK